MPRALNQQIPDTEHRKARFHQRQQFLVEDQKLAERKAAQCTEVKHRSDRGQPTALQLKDQESLTFELRANERFLVAFDLAFER